MSEAERRGIKPVAIGDLLLAEILEELVAIKTLLSPPAPPQAKKKELTAKRPRNE